MIRKLLCWLSFHQRDVYQGIREWTGYEIRTYYCKHCGKKL